MPLFIAFGKCIDGIVAIFVDLIGSIVQIGAHVISSSNWQLQLRLYDQPV